MTGLRLSPDLTMPVEVAGEALAILAKRGAGKTNTATVLVEELHGADIQVAILDPVGVWWGLRAGENGLSIPVLGGAHGDVPLEPAAGELIADVVVDTGQSIVIDLSEFSKTQQRTFVAAFATRLYRRKASQRSLLHVVLEEADEFAPQRVTSADAPMVGAISQLIRRGRSRGIGMTVVTQRSASLNKDVLDQADVLIAMRTTGPRDRKAIEGWIEHQDADGVEEVLPSLPSMETGEAWVWNPERSLLRRVRVRPRSTFDSSRTGDAGAVEPRVIAPINLDALGERIAETAERAKQNDPVELRRQIRELEARAADAMTYTRAEPVVETVNVEVPVFTAEETTLLEEVLAALQQSVAINERVYGLLDIVKTRVTNAVDVARQPSPSVPARQSTTPRREAPAPAGQRKHPADRPGRSVPRAAPDRGASGGGSISGPQQRILDALAWFEAIGVDAPRRPPLAAVAGVSSKSSGFRANVSTLSGLGLLTYTGDSRVTLTEDGRAQASPVDRPPTHAELHDAVCRMVSGPQATLLSVLIDRYPEPIGRDDLAAAAGVSPASSGFRANVSTLSGLEVVEYPAGGLVRASEVLFP